MNKISINIDDILSFAQRTHKYKCVTLHGDCQVDVETTNGFAKEFLENTRKN